MGSTNIHSTLTDERALIRRANDGDDRAFEALYEAHERWVLSLARRLTANEDDALDVLQETFTYFFRKFPGFVLTTTLRGFLFPVVRNLSMTVLRKRRRIVDLDLEQQHASGRLVWHPPPVSELDKMVQRLPEGQRQVVLLRFGAQLQLAEIAELLEIPPGTVKSRLHQALNALRRR